MVTQVYNPERLRHEDYCEFKASLKMGRKGGEGKEKHRREGRNGGEEGDGEGRGEKEKRLL